MTTLARRTGTTAVFVGAAFTTVIASRYLSLDPAVYFPEQRDTYLGHQAGIIVHVVGGMIAMLVGPFQFVPGLRARFLAAHRWMGRLYVSGVAAGGLAGLYMSQFAYGGFPAGAGFAFLAVVWLTCTGMALREILRRRPVAHREWMLRSYALTLAALTLRLWLPAHGILEGAGVVSVPFSEMYVAVAWLCWVPNLILAEIYINRTRA